MVIWYFDCHFGIFYGHSVFLWPFVIFGAILVYFSILVCVAKKNLATLVLKRVNPSEVFLQL
jgi:hypothetical protein